MSDGKKNDEPAVEIVFDAARIDFEWAIEALKSAYWAAARPDEVNRRAFQNSFCAAAFLDGRQVAFGRVITDRAAIAYLADVIVAPEQRGRGIARRLVAALLDHPEFSTVSSWTLRTTDAHGLYESFGFRTSSDGLYMRLDRDTGQAAR